MEHAFAEAHVAELPDIKRAYFNAKVDRDVAPGFVQTPAVRRTPSPYARYFVLR